MEAKRGEKMAGWTVPDQKMEPKQGSRRSGKAPWSRRWKGAEYNKHYNEKRHHAFLGT